MAQPWDADVELSLEAAARLIEQQFPDLAPTRLEPLGVGWDNLALLVNESLVFRFPRRRIAAPFLEQENRILPMLASSLPLPIPFPTHLGRPNSSYPYPFGGYRLISGISASQLAWSEEQRAKNAVPLARFLAALHSIPVDGETRAWAPADDLGRADVRRRAPGLKQRLHAIALSLGGMDIAPLDALVDRVATAAPHAGPPCWVHGDLYARHLLVDDARQLCGVIDWGDVHLGDPALDLSIAFSFLSFSARETFRQSYGPIDAPTWDRARFRALRYAALLIGYGADIGDHAIRAAGEYALRAAGI